MMVFGPFLKGIGAAIALIPKLGTVFTAICSPIGLVIVAIAGVVTAGILLYKNWDKIKVKLVKIWDNIKKKAQDIWDGIKKKLSEIWTDIKDTASDVWNGIKGFFKEWGDEILLIAVGPAGWAVLLAKKLSINWDSIKSKTEAVWNGIKDSLGRAWDTIKAWASEKWERIKATITGITGGISTALSTKWAKIKSNLTSKWESLKSAASSIFSRIADAITRPFRNIHIPTPHFDFRTIEKTIAGITFPVPKLSVDWYAQGTNFAPGGWAVVGEKGPELVNLPRGSQVIPNHELATTGGFTIQIENMYVRSDQDIKLIARELFGLLQSRSRAQGVIG